MSNRTRQPRWARRLHELGLKLAVLMAVTAATFGLTVTAAAQLHHLTDRDARTFYTQGTAALRIGQLGTAITFLQRATAKDRANQQYALAFAQALALNGQVEGAERNLLALRERAPEDPDVNLELARLAARSDETAMALRYYRNALYAPWRAADGPRRVRRELIEYLLDHNDRDRALSELIAARVTVPDDAASHIDLGRLLLRAGDAGLALAEFRRAQTVAPGDATALRLAGEAAYRLGDYSVAARDLADAATADPDAARMRTTAVAVLRDDPLAPRIPAGERQRRIQRLLSRAAERATACGIEAPRVTATAAPNGRDTEALERALDAVDDTMRQAESRCPDLTPEEQAVLIIGARHRDADR